MQIFFITNTNNKIHTKLFNKIVVQSPNSSIIPLKQSRQLHKIETFTTIPTTFNRHNDKCEKLKKQNPN